MRGMLREGSVEGPFLEHGPDLVGVELHAVAVVFVVIEFIVDGVIL